MADPDQKIILIEPAYDELKSICSKLQDESGAKNMRVKTLLRKLASAWEEDMNDEYDIDREV